MQPLIKFHSYNVRDEALVTALVLRVVEWISHGQQ